MNGSHQTLNGRLGGSLALPAIGLLLTLAVPAAARTIVLTDEDCERVAALSPDTPRLSWAAEEIYPGVYSTKFSMVLKSGKALLIAFPLDKIPKGQRITNAELVVPVNYVEGEQRLTVRRILGSWGAGVCYQYRTVRPKPVEWTRPGATASGSDFAAKATAQVRISDRSPKTVNVTEDVELWYTGAAANQGWMFRLEDQNAHLQLLSPLSHYPAGRGAWKLRITYEPE
jgi:hypothetical protein